MHFKLLAAHEHELKYVDYPDTLIIGNGACNLREDHLKNVKAVVLFGCSGLLQNGSYDIFYIPNRWFKNNSSIVPETLGFDIDGIQDVIGYTSSHSVKTLAEVDLIYNSTDALIADQESYIVAEMCDNFNIPFVSVRYIIDRCYKKCMPTGVNHFWRKFQHKRMQEKFNSVLAKI